MDRVSNDSIICSIVARKVCRLAFLSAFLVIIGGCSVQKNTWATRSYHQTTTRFNVLFNGNNAYKEGLEAIDKANKDNFSEVLPLYPVSNHDAISAGTSQMDKSIEKCRKSIKLHSIKKKPKPNPKKTGDPKYKEWLKQEEFNENLDDAWILLGCSEFHKGDFLGAIGTFNYIIKHYEYDKDMVAQCQLWSARAYAEMGWLYEAEDILRKVNQDDLSRKHSGLYAAVNADYLIRTKQYQQAIPFVKTAMKKEHRNGYRPRFTYILGQLYEQAGDRSSALEQYRQVVKMQPTEVLEFNAKLRMSILDGSDKSVKRLKRMAKDYKNKDRLELVYGAIGDIYLSRRDTVQALENYDLAISQATQSTLDKAAILVRAGDLYYQQRNYVKAQPCYQEASGIYTVDHADYTRIRRLADMLGELVVEYNTVQLQDSLQYVASLPEDSQLVIVNKIIDDLKIQEEEQREQLKRQARGDFDDDGLMSVNTSNMLGGGQQNADWYFYNANLMRQGKQDFTKKWGNRQLEDDWRHSQKVVMATFMGDEEATEFAADSLSGDSTATVAAVKSSNDPHDPQYYLQNLPVTEQQIEASNALIESALYKMIYIYQDKIEDLNMADETFAELQRRFPKSDYLVGIYFDKYLSAWRKSDNEQVGYYKNIILSDYPSTDQAKIVSQPDYFAKLQKAEQIQDSLYEDTYNAYMKGDYKQVKRNTSYAESEIPSSRLMPRFLFLNAVSVAKTESQDKFIERLQDLVARYPESEMGSMAKEMLAMMNQEMEVKQSNADNTELLSLRGEVQTVADTTETNVQWSDEVATRSYVVVAIPKQEDMSALNDLLYQVALFNFSQFLIKEFDLETAQHFTSDLSALKISGFESIAETQWYADLLQDNADMKQVLTTYNARLICINDANYRLLVSARFTLEQYREWEKTQNNK